MKKVGEQTEEQEWQTRVDDAEKAKKLLMG